MTTATRDRAGKLDLRQQDVGEFLSCVRLVEDNVDGEALTSDLGRAELAQYVFLHERSAHLSLAMIARHVQPGSGPRVLELGGAPYFFSALMHRVFDADLVAVNVEAGAWPGVPATRERSTVTLAVPEASDRTTYEGEGARIEGTRDAGRAGRSGADDTAPMTIDVRIFNIEKDPFPFPDDSFDVVLCMEVLEHLGYSPSQMLAETHRVMRPDGTLFLTVPNFINIKRTVSMLLNRRCQYPYSGYGIYGRHQREFAPKEVRDLLEASNFDVTEFRTANVWPTFRGDTVIGLGNAALNLFSRVPLPWIENKREMILCASRPRGEPVVSYPSWLYDHRHLYPDPPNGVRKVLID